MKRLFLFLELLFVIGAAVTLWLIETSPAHKAVIPVFGNSEATVFSSGRLTQLLALGKQSDAERLVRHPQNLEEIFWKAVMVKSRFDDRGSMPLFISVIRESTDSPCVSGNRILPISTLFQLRWDGEIFDLLNSILVADKDRCLLYTSDAADE